MNLQVVHNGFVIWEIGCTTLPSMYVILPNSNLLLLVLMQPQVLGEIAFSRRFGFLETGTDVEGQIKSIDDVQWYDGIVGQVPWTDILFRNNPLRPYLPFWQPKLTTMTKIAVQELEKRKEHGEFEIDETDLMGQLLKAHAGNPDKFSEADVFAIAHGAM